MRAVMHALATVAILLWALPSLAVGQFVRDLGTGQLPRPGAASAREGTAPIDHLAIAYHPADSTPSREALPVVTASAVGEPSSRLRHVGIGALVGGATLGGLAAYHAIRCNACFFREPFIVISAGGGAALGDLIGFIVREARRP